MGNSSLITKGSKVSDQSYSESDINAKLRRLKIQDEILTQSIHDFGGGSHLNYNDNFQFVTYSENLNDTYSKIKNMFCDMKAKVQDNDLDINEIKNNVHELEDNIKSCKQYLQSEIRTLKISEDELTKQINYDIKDNEIKKRSTIQTVSYKEIVPSPVKKMMNSPLKCLEVQEFQDFLAQSQNRYGGWNEYNHNIFKKLWTKYFGINNSDEFDDLIHSDQFANFIEECHKNIYGLQRQCIVSHVEWYVQYLNLKNRQQKAIEKWKNNRKALNKGIKNNHTIQTSVLESTKSKSRSWDGFERETIKSSVDEILRADNSAKTNSLHPRVRNRNSLTYKNPTKQWIYRCNEIEEHLSCITNIENTKKLRIPDWRRVLVKF